MLVIILGMHLQPFHRALALINRKRFFIDIGCADNRGPFTLNALFREDLNAYDVLMDGVEAASESSSIVLETADGVSKPYDVLLVAAPILAMTQPAVSNAIKRLRESLGDELLIRTAYGVKPTPRAEALWPSVRSALASLEAAVAPETFDVSAAHATFRLAMADATAAMWLPSLMRSIEREAPGVNVRMMPLTTREPRPMLLRGDIDLAVGFFPGVAAQLSYETGSPIRHERLYSGQYVCVMRREHPLAKVELNLDNYCKANHLLVSFSGRAHGLVDEALAQLQRERRILLTVNQFFTAGRVVANSDLQ